MSQTERKELQKIEAFREHTVALHRHMENTSTYLKKEVQSVEAKIEDAKMLLMKELQLNLYLDDDYQNGVNTASEKRLIEKEIREVEEEDQEDEEEEEEEEEHETEDDFGNIDEAGVRTEE